MLVFQKTRLSGERVVALGTFDGVHRGHQTLIRRAKQIADEAGIPLRLCTFNRHPLEVLCPENPPELLSTIPEKAHELAALGVDEMELIRFDRQMADLEPEAFLERLRRTMNVRTMVAGWNYSFGRKGRGDAKLLQEDGIRYHYDVLIVPPARTPDGTVVSSTLIRQKLREGLISDAAMLMGHEYRMTGTVVEGKHLGHALGFPTANIQPWKRKLIPGRGVYLCLLHTGGRSLPAMVNIGLQPTIPSGLETVEAHVLTEDPMLYGQKVSLMIRKKMRDERRFDSPEALRKQLEKDRREALNEFGMA